MEFSYGDNNDWLSVREVRADFKKFPELLQDGDAVCYIDNRGNEYTGKDLKKLIPDASDLALLFESLKGQLPKDFLNGSWEFIQCPRCGYWHRKDDGGFFSKKDTICPYCRPVRTNGIIKVINDPYEDDRKFFSKKTFSFRPGLTTLIGCNGAGKTTVLMEVREDLKAKGVPFLHFDNLGSEGGARSFGTLFSGYGTDDDIEDTTSYALSLWSCSEGERIKDAIARFARRVIKEMKRHAGFGEFWILIDALDSGLSVDASEEIKTYLFKAILENAGDMQVYLLVSSNSYEMSEDTACWSVTDGKYVAVKNYSAFKKAILKSREQKELRDAVFEVKAEIRQRPYAFSFDGEAVNVLENRRGKRSVRLEVASLEKEGYKMTCIGSSSSGYVTNYRYQLVKNGKTVSCKDFDDDSYSLPRREDLERNMHEYVCRKIFLDERKGGDR